MDNLKMLIVVVLAITGIVCSVYFNVTWTYGLLVDIINACRSTNVVPAEDIAWMIIKVCMRGFVFMFSTLAALIPAGLASAILK